MEARDTRNPGEAADAVQRNDRLLRTLTEKSLAGIYLVQDGVFRFLNTNAASYANYEVSELIGQKSGSFIHPEDRERVKADARAMLRGERSAPYVFRILTKQGKTRWVMETVTPFFFNGRPALLGNSMNITDRMEAEERLRESEDRYRTIFETTGTATIIVEEDTTVTLVNTEFETLSGAPKEYWEGKRKWTEFVHEKDRERMLGYHYRRRVEPEAVPRNYEFSLVDRQGGVRDVIITISLIPGTKKSVASFADISDRRRAEERLRESEDRYRTIFETTGTATIIVEEDTTVTLVNTEFEKLAGAPKEYWEGRRKWTEFVHADDRDRMLQYHYQRRVDPESAPRNYEFSLVDTQGEVREVIITISLIPGTKRSVASFVDITERKQAEEALKKNERDLTGKTHELEELNAALRVLLKRREEDKLELEDNVTSNLKKLVMPYIEKIKKGRLEGEDLVCLNVIESNLKDIASPFASRLSSEYLSLTPKELQVADLIKEGKTTKEIAEFMSLSPATVEIHRYHIREKLGLSRKKTNLRTYLSSLK
ncbi:MAG: PAS domain S-box protein [Syntrophales bacterium]|jgi:PAS domain S-box-containing protein|nr:PAS domain S-box protein [Syntrophales bacterium]